MFDEKEDEVLVESQEAPVVPETPAPVEAPVETPAPVEAPVEPEPMETESFEASRPDITPEKTPLAYEIMSTVDPQNYPMTEDKPETSDRREHVLKSHSPLTPAMNATLRTVRKVADATVYYSKALMAPGSPESDAAQRSIAQGLKAASGSYLKLNSMLQSGVASALTYVADTMQGEDVFSDATDTSVLRGEEGVIRPLQNFYNNLRAVANRSEELAASRSEEAAALLERVDASAIDLATQIAFEAGQLPISSLSTIVRLAGGGLQTLEMGEEAVVKALGFVVGEDSNLEEAKTAFSAHMINTANSIADVRGKNTLALIGDDPELVNRIASVCVNGAIDAYTFISTIQGASQALGNVSPFMAGPTGAVASKVGKAAYQISGNQKLAYNAAQTFQRALSSAHSGTIVGLLTPGTWKEKASSAMWSTLFRGTTAISGNVQNDLARFALDFGQNAALSTIKDYRKLYYAAEQGEMTWTDAALSATPSMILDLWFAALTGAHGRPTSSFMKVLESGSKAVERVSDADYYDIKARQRTLGNADGYRVSAEQERERDHGTTKVVAGIDNLGDQLRTVASSEYTAPGQREMIGKILEVGGLDGARTEWAYGITDRDGNQIPMEITADGTVRINAEMVNRGLSVRDFTDAAIHEAGHARSLGLLQAAGTARLGAEDAPAAIQRAVESGKITEADGKILSDLAEAYKSASQDEGLKSEYGLNNFAEFIAETYANRAFQEKTSKLAWEGKGIFEKVSEATKELLGIRKDDVVLNNVFNRAFDLAYADQKYSGTDARIAGEIKSGNRDAEILADREWLDAAAAPQIREQAIKAFGDNDTAREIADGLIKPYRDAGKVTPEDLAKYKELSEKAFGNLKTAQDVESPERMKAWGELEALKNKYGGVSLTDLEVGRDGFQAPRRAEEIGQQIMRIPLGRVPEGIRGDVEAAQSAVRGFFQMSPDEQARNLNAIRKHVLVATNPRTADEFEKAFMGQQEFAYGAPPRKDYIDSRLYDNRDYLDLPMAARSPAVNFLKTNVDKILETAANLKEPLTPEAVRELEDTRGFWGEKVNDDTAMFLKASMENEDRYGFLRDFNAYLANRGRPAMMAEAELENRIPENIRHLKRAIQQTKGLSPGERMSLHKGINLAAKAWGEAGFKGDVTKVKGVKESSAEALKAALYAPNAKAALEALNKIRSEGGKRGLDGPSEHISDEAWGRIASTVPKKFRDMPGFDQLKKWVDPSAETDNTDVQRAMAQAITRLAVQRARLGNKPLEGRGWMQNVGDMRYALGDLAIAMNDPVLYKAQEEFFRQKSKADHAISVRTKDMLKAAGLPPDAKLWVANNADVSDAMARMMYYAEGDKTMHMLGGKKMSGDRIHREAKKVVEKSNPPYGSDKLLKVVEQAKAEMGGASLQNFKENALFAFGRAFDRSPFTEINESNADLIPTIRQGKEAVPESLKTMTELWSKAKVYGIDGVRGDLAKLDWGRETYWPSERTKVRDAVSTEVAEREKSGTPVAVKGAQSRVDDKGPATEGGFFRILENHMRRMEIQARTFEPATQIMESVAGSKIGQDHQRSIEGWMRKALGTHQVTSTEKNLSKVNAALQTAFWVPHLISKADEYTMRNLMGQTILGVSLLGPVDGVRAIKDAIKNDLDPNSRLNAYMKGEFMEELARDEHIQQSIYNSLGEFSAGGPGEKLKAFGRNKAGFAAEKAALGTKRAASEVAIWSDIKNRKDLTAIYYSNAERQANRALADGAKVKSAIKGLHLESVRSEEQVRLLNMFNDGLEFGTREGMEPFIREYARKRNLAVNLQYKGEGRSLWEQNPAIRASLGVFTYRKGIATLTYTAAIEPLMQAVSAGDKGTAAKAGMSFASMAVATMFSNVLQELVMGRQIKRDGTPVGSYSMTPLLQVGGEIFPGQPMDDVLAGLGFNANQLAVAALNGEATPSKIYGFVQGVADRIPLLGRMAEISARAHMVGNDVKAQNEMLYLADVLRGKGVHEMRAYSQRIDRDDLRGYGKFTQTVWGREWDPEATLSVDNVKNLATQALLNIQPWKTEKD